jgi:hypothetical protein
MGMVVPGHRLASAVAVLSQRYGAVSYCAQQRGVCRQWIYREAAWVLATLAGTEHQQQVTQLGQQVRHLQQRVAALEKQLAQAVVLDREKQAEVASVGQAIGVSLPEVHILLEVLRPGQIASVATLGRRTKAAGEQSGVLLAVFDEYTRAQVRQAAADEIYVTDPVLMVVEPESLCWVSGRLTESISGEAWAKEFRQLPALEQVTRDGGKALGKGVATVNEERQKQEAVAVADQLDHFHTLRGGSQGVRKQEGRLREALAEADARQKEWQRRQRHGQSENGFSHRARDRWAKAGQAMDAWQERDTLWQKTKAALQLITPEGELNTRGRAEAILAQTLPQLPDADFAKPKRMLQQPETLTYLDEVGRKLAVLPVPVEVRQAAIRQEGLRRRPELLQGDSPCAAALRGVLLVCAVVLAKAGAVGQLAVQGVQAIFRNTWRASSLVECINSVLRMHQSRHRKMSQGLLDLKRLYWNCHMFRTGRRRKTTPYQRLGVPWPEGLRWWDMLKWSPEQLRDKLSTLKRVE